MNMEIVEGQTNRNGITIDLREGRLKAFSISEAKLRLFRDGGTLIGRFNDWACALFTCGISFLVGCLTTTIIVVRYVLATLTIICFVASIVLFVIRKKKKNELSALYDEVISGEM